MRRPGRGLPTQIRLADCRITGRSRGNGGVYTGLVLTRGYVLLMHAACKLAAGSLMDFHRVAAKKIPSILIARILYLFLPNNLIHFNLIGNKILETRIWNKVVESTINNEVC